MNIPLLIVILYVLLLFGISIYVSYSQKKDSENFLLYKGKNNAFVVAASIAGLAIGGASTIGIAENAFTVGLSAGWYDTAWAIGGMGSVSLTNVLNMVLIYVGVILAAALVLWNHGGWEAIDVLTKADPDTPYLSLTAGMGWMGILSWIVVMLGNTNSVQGVVQIGLTGKSDRSATVGFIVGAILMVPVGFICALLGVASRALLPDAEASVALPMILMSIPPVLGGITLSGLWAADMGTGCSMIIGLATTVSTDIIGKIPGVSLNDRQKHILNKVIVVLSSLVTYLIATQMGAILSAMQKALSLAIGTSFIVIGGLLCPKFSSRKAGFWTIMASIVSIVAWNMVPALVPVFKNVGFFMLAVCGAVFILISLVDPEKVKQ